MNALLRFADYRPVTSGDFEEADFEAELDGQSSLVTVRVSRSLMASLGFHAKPDDERRDTVCRLAAHHLKDILQKNLKVPNSPVLITDYDYDSESIRSRIKETRDYKNLDFEIEKPRRPIGFISKTGD